MHMCIEAITHSQLYLLEVDPSLKLDTVGGPAQSSNHLLILRDAIQE